MQSANRVVSFDAVQRSSARDWGSPKLFVPARRGSEGPSRPVPTGAYDSNADTAGPVPIDPDLICCCIWPSACPCGLGCEPRRNAAVRL
jgi:hypothetical protein